tara:strand:+ start:698 stop:1201 length:504 start_codon:yes stop_codon:yes gene_type:complete
MSVVKIQNPRSRWWNNEILGLFNILGAYNRANNRSFCTCAVYELADHSKSMNINTFQVLAVLRLDYNSLKNTNLDGTLTDQQLAQLYIDAMRAQSAVLAAGTDGVSSRTSATSHFTDNYIKNSVSNTYHNYTPWAKSLICCQSRSSDDIRFTLSGPLGKFVDQLKKI